MKDLENGAELELNADLIMFLYREDYDECREPGLTELTIKRHRLGPVGTIRLAHSPALNRFTSIIRQ